MLDEIDHLLDDAIALHEERKFFLASEKYLKILEQDTLHADTNHNFGLLKIELGLKEEALIFLQTAINTNPNVLQYWVTFINTLTNVERFDDAKSVLEQAHLFGHKHKTLNHLEHNLNLAHRKYETLIKPDQLNVSKSMNAETNYRSSVKAEEKTSIISQANSCIQDSDKRQANILDAMKLDKALKLAKKKVIEGLSEKAERIYQDILVKFPKNKRAMDGLKGLAGVLNSSDKMSEVQDPPQGQQQSIINLYSRGQVEQSLQQASILLQQFPNSSFLYNISGAAYKGLDQLDAAVEAYKRAIYLKPDFAEAHNNMGIILKDQGKLAKAIVSYNKALSIKPEFAEAYYNLGDALKDQGKLEMAKEAYHKALIIKPDFAKAYNNMGIILKDQGKLAEAIVSYNKALSIKHDFAEAYNNMGNVLQEQGKLEEAMEAYTKALTIKPDNADAYYNMGNALVDQGRLEEAIEAYTKTLTLTPGFANAHRNLSSIKKYTEDDKHFLQVQEIFNRRDLSENDRCHLSFALSKMHEGMGELDKSFTYLYEGNALRKKLLNYSIEQDERLFSRLKKSQPKLSKNKLAINEEPSKRSPIFILGMPRSGTTLVEQIISSHSEVSAAGELIFVKQYGFTLATEPTAINAAAVSEFRQKYLSELTKISSRERLVTDKMPQNFRFIPLICAALPEAKIIHVQRNAAATCWSNYKQYFVTDGIGYCYDIHDVASYYKLYNDLMNFWQAEYSDRIYNLNYENLTTDQENQTKKLIDHLELIWEEACLSPQKNKRSVRTASQQQVRQKIYQGSSNTWKKYRPYLNGVFDSLPSS